MRLYLDANIIIYAIEGAAQFRDAALTWIDRARAAPGGQVLTSRISRLECRSKPLAARDPDLLARYDQFLRAVRIGELSPELVEQATDLRARFALRGLDALHLATAARDEADVFLTGDRHLQRCTDVNVVVLN